MRRLGKAMDKHWTGNVNGMNTNVNDCDYHVLVELDYDKSNSRTAGDLKNGN